MCIFATKQIRAVNISRTKKRIAKDISLSQFAVKRAISDLRKKNGNAEAEQRYRTKDGNSTLQFKIKSYPINTKG